MIKLRNLDPSLIQWILTETNLGPGIGELHFVAKPASSTSAYRGWLQSMGVEQDYKIHTSIQAALDETEDYRNDVVLVFPGTYTESLVKDLNNVQVMGIGKAGVRPMARIHPIATAAFTGEFVDSGFNNLEFFSPSAPTAECAAIVFETADDMFNMRHSYVDNCFFSGGAVDDIYESMGIVLGALVEDNTAWEFAEFSRIYGNTFSAVAGRTRQLTCAITVGAYLTSAGGCEFKGITGCDISYNHINAQAIGIKLNVGQVGCPGTYITHNHIGSVEFEQGTGLYGIRFNSANTDQLCFVSDNRVASQGTAISNVGTAGFVFANWVGSAGTLAHQSPTIATS